MNFYQGWGQGCQLFFRRFRLKTIKDILDFILLIWYIKYINRKGMVYYMEALDIDISGMAGALIEHSMVISNFLIKAGSQVQDSICRVFGDNVQYKWIAGGEEKIVIPDVSINCRFKQRRGNSFFNNPRFVMEVLSPSTESYDRGKKMELYRQQEIDEYWIVDWRKRQIEIYVLDYEDNMPKYYLWKTVINNNKDELKMVHFQNVVIKFDDLFDGIDYEPEMEE